MGKGDNYIQDPKTGKFNGSTKSSNNSTNASKGQKGSRKSTSDNTTSNKPTTTTEYVPPKLGMPAIRTGVGGR
ncbi:MAG: hypothetical protein HQK88_02190 [Nitrospirae bacterium]|nr:hypothetical protein [Nitrospirota bacterium]MBF0534411.1 hypothetical protein [Nitrospirota bacterium]MBF0615608.1 hypothetical protein [Nitrospirota bacterium]